MPSREYTAIRVGELIERLSLLPPDAVVCRPYWDGDYSENEYLQADQVRFNELSGDVELFI